MDAVAVVWLSFWVMVLLQCGYRAWCRREPAARAAAMPDWLTQIQVQMQIQLQLSQREAGQGDVEAPLPTAQVTWEPGAHVEACCVCLTDYEAGDVLTTLPCNHVFHPPCIAAWLARKAVCPLCNI